MTRPKDYERQGGRRPQAAATSDLRGDARAIKTGTRLPVAPPAVAGECLLSDMHLNLHRGEKCPECDYDPEA